jgi:hypothetical protein
MFTIPRINVIESDNGFSVEVLGRTGMRYREGSRSVSVDSEVLAPGKGIAIYVNSIRKWDAPYQEQSISAEDKSRIVANIKSAMDFRQEPIEIL